MTISVGSKSSPFKILCSLLPHSKYSCVVNLGRKLNVLELASLSESKT